MFRAVLSGFLFTVIEFCLTSGKLFQGTTAHLHLEIRHKSEIQISAVVLSMVLLVLNEM